ncbi:NAD(P)/FAD-dependent oxidoreductase [Roseococcus sp. SDR]|uniref:FAD-dependent oxidoreductase n=1 Tax=Roseococcus sp. SDR TaxID=2835532 RepID=UPI001BD1390C|nr:(2Fe-2S)-binding protein [Roseococcus sp. SDR]MBV1846667.1 NAD(P)/FAD-dependent oxidoreductase [Roseococcus sp. SDR]
MREIPLLILGAGPAGLAAAAEAASQGIQALLLDENPAPGGQVHRAVGGFYRPDPGAPGADQAAEGLALIEAASASGVECRYGATLWAIQEDGVVTWSEGGAAQQALASVLLLCPGATERPMPIPGWTLPGVMGVGAAQILMKTAGLLPEGKTWLAGQGPLLWLYAAQLLDKGVTPAGILDLSPPGIPWRALPHLPMALRAPGYLLKGLDWMRRLRRAGVPVIKAREVAALGRDRLTGISIDGKEMEADLLLLHDGVVPNTQVTRALPGCAHVWDSAQMSFRPVLDEWGNTSLNGLLVAGDGGGIGGARAAALSGRIAALEAARWLGRLTPEQRDALAGPLLHRRSAELAPRALLDALYPPLPMARVADDTLVCRCEEITAGRIRAAVALGAQGPNQIKAFLRAGMGPCQGRVCGPAVHALMAEARGVAPGALEPLRTRFPTKPVTVGEIAALADAG